MTTWQAAYDAAWDEIRDGLGGLGGHLEASRAFVGDPALLRLMREFEPGEVVIAIGIQIAATVLRQPFGKTPEPVEVAVADAHAALIAREGDAHWRRILPPNAERHYRRELNKLIQRGAPK